MSIRLFGFTIVKFGLLYGLLTLSIVGVASVFAQSNEALFSLEKPSIATTEVTWVLVAEINLAILNHNTFLIPFPYREAVTARRLGAKQEITRGKYRTSLSRGELFDRDGTKWGNYVLSAALGEDDQGVYLGVFTNQGQAFELSKDSSQTYTFRTFEPGDSSCGGTLADEGLVSGLNNNEVPSLSMSGTQLNAITDVLIVFTPNVRLTFGGTAQALAYFLAAIDDANTSLINSEIHQELRLVAYYELSQAMPHETNPTLEQWQSDLQNLRQDGDGWWDEVHAIRDDYGADLVSAFTHPIGGNIAGLGYMLNDQSTGFSIVWDQQAVPNHSFAHELGHNMGAQHDRPNANTPGLLDNSYGWHWIGDSGNSWRSVMAYAPGIRVPYFSNPDVLYDGQPTGAPEANNAYTLNYSASIVSNFRTTVVAPPVSTPDPTRESNSHSKSSGSAKETPVPTQITRANGTPPPPVLVPQPAPKPRALPPSMTGYSVSGQIKEGKHHPHLVINVKSETSSDMRTSVNSSLRPSKNGRFNLNLGAGEYIVRARLVRAKHSAYKVSPASIRLRLPSDAARDIKFRISKK